MSFISIAYARECVTGGITAPNQETYSTTYCDITVSIGGLGDINVGGQTFAFINETIGGDDDGGWSDPEIIFSTEVPFDYMPAHHDPTYCSDPGMTRQVAANAAFLLWKATQKEISNQQSPNQENYLIRFSNGIELYKWEFPPMYGALRSVNGNCEPG